MTSLEFVSMDAGLRGRKRTSRLNNWFAELRRRREQRLTLMELSRLDARLLRDMGIEPLDITDALRGRRRSVLFHPMRRADHE